MAYTPPEYPNTLTKTYWDSKKGKIAKMTETGVGKAAAAAEAAFDKIKWIEFDIVRKTPLASDDEAYKKIKGFKDDVVGDWKQMVQPCIAALRELRGTAEDAAKTLSKGLLTKDAGKIAAQIAKDADHFSVALQMNGVFFSDVAAECEKSLAAIEKNRKIIADNMKQTKVYLGNLLTGLVAFKKIDPPTMKGWDDLVKQHGRSVSNNLKGNPALAKKYLKTWTTKFKGFDWTMIGFDKFDDEQDLKKEVASFIGEVAREAALLKEDL